MGGRVWTAEQDKSLSSPGAVDWRQQAELQDLVHVVHEDTRSATRLSDALPACCDRKLHDVGQTSPGSKVSLEQEESIGHLATVSSVCKTSGAASPQRGSAVGEETMLDHSHHQDGDVTDESASTEDGDVRHASEAFRRPRPCMDHSRLSDVVSSKLAEDGQAYRLANVAAESGSCVLGEGDALDDDSGHVSPAVTTYFAAVGGERCADVERAHLASALTSEGREMEPAAACVSPVLATMPVAAVLVEEGSKDAESCELVRKRASGCREIAVDSDNEANIKFSRTKEQQRYECHESAGSPDRRAVLHALGVACSPIVGGRDVTALSPAICGFGQESVDVSPAPVHDIPTLAECNVLSEDDRIASPASGGLPSTASDSTHSAELSTLDPPRLDEIFDAQDAGVGREGLLAGGHGQSSSTLAVRSAEADSAAFSPLLDIPAFWSSNQTPVAMSPRALRTSVAHDFRNVCASEEGAEDVERCADHATLSGRTTSGKGTSSGGNDGALKAGVDNDHQHDQSDVAVAEPLLHVKMGRLRISEGSVDGGKDSDRADASLENGTPRRRDLPSSGGVKAGLYAPLPVGAVFGIIC